MKRGAATVGGGELLDATERRRFVQYARVEADSLRVLLEGRACDGLSEVVVARLRARRLAYEIVANDLASFESEAGDVAP